MKRIPKFKNLKEEREFWDTHTIVDYLDELKETTEITFEKPPLKRNFQMRLDDATIGKLKKLARLKDVYVSTLIRNWIREHLDKELSAPSVRTFNILQKRKFLYDELNRLRRDF